VRSVERCQASCGQRDELRFQLGRQRSIAGSIDAGVRNSGQDNAVDSELIEKPIADDQRFRFREERIGVDDEHLGLRLRSPYHGLLETELPFLPLQQQFATRRRITTP